MSNLNVARDDLYNWADENMKSAYKNITAHVKNAPAAARSFEKTELMSYAQNLREKAREFYTQAFQKDGMEYPGLLWTEQVNPKLGTLTFKYCSVTPNSGTGEPKLKYQIEGGENREKFPDKAWVAAGATAVGVVAKVGGHFAAAASSSAVQVSSSAVQQVLSVSGTVLSTTGTLLIICGVVAGLYAFAVPKEKPDFPNNQVKGKTSFSDSSYQYELHGLDPLMKEQETYNWGVVKTWLDELALYARKAEEEARKKP